MKPSRECVESFRNYLVNLVEDYTGDFVGYALNPEEFEKKPDFEKEGNSLKLLVLGFMDCLICQDYIDQGDIKAGAVDACLSAMLKPGSSVKDYQKRKKAYFKAVDDFCEYLLEQ